MYINIKCKGRCYICDNPLEPYVKSNNWQVRDLVRFYKRNVSPLFCYNNVIFYKIYKLKAKKICYSCFKHGNKKITCEQLRRRESGQFNYFNRIPSLSEKDINSWFQKLYKYIKKNMIRIDLYQIFMKKIFKKYIRM